MTAERPNLLKYSILCGAGIALLLGALSVYLFPGGNHFDPQQAGYSWTENWLCDSFRPWTHGGQDNRLGSKFAGAAMIVFAWLSIFPGFAFTLNSELRQSRFRLLLVLLALVSAAGMTLLTLSMMLEWTFRHEFFVWITIGPTLLMGICFGVIGWRNGLFPGWFVVLLVTVVAVIFADIGVWQYRVWCNDPPTFWEPFLMKIATLLVGAMVIGLSLLTTRAHRNSLET